MTLTYYYFYLDDDILEQLKKEIIKSSLEGNIILFVSQYDLPLLESILKTLDKFFPKKNILYILPIRIWGNLRDYIKYLYLRNEKSSIRSLVCEKTRNKGEGRKMWSSSYHNDLP